VAVLLFVPETRYMRDLSGTQSITSTPTSASDVDLDTEKEAQPEVKVTRQPSDEAIAPVPTKTFSQEISLWSGIPSTNLFKMFIRPFSMIVYPAVIYAFLCYAIALVIVVAVNILNPFVLQAPPYSWKPQINGLINIPGLLGNVFGAWAGGKR
jgi:hypothetical protein